MYLLTTIFNYKLYSPILYGDLTDKMFTSLGFCLVFIIEISSYSYYGPTRKTIHAPTRKTIYGWIRGKVTTRVPGLKVEEYLGMPYALPPIGQFRFKV